MVAREYVGRYLPEANRTRAESIAGEIRDALVRGLERNAWMDDATRAEAGKKLAALKIEVGAPRRDVDYTVQPMGRGSFGGNMLIASTWHHREEMKRIGRGNAQRRWPVQPHQPALVYDAAHNRLVVSAAMLQAPVLDMSRDGAAHYGALGALIAHELSHAIDGKGRMLDAAGNVRDWWTPATDGAWNDRINRLSAQYGAYDIPNLEGRKVNATLTRSENAADLAAMELAWDALQLAQPGIAKEGKQAFFGAWAELWRQQPSAVFAEQQAATSQHAPGKWRANGPLGNQPAFGETFACKASDAMRRKDDDQVSIWR
jgi:putative endopeptidase